MNQKMNWYPLGTGRLEVSKGFEPTDGYLSVIQQKYPRFVEHMVQTVVRQERNRYNRLAEEARSEVESS